MMVFNDSYNWALDGTWQAGKALKKKYRTNLSNLSELNNKLIKMSSAQGAQGQALKCTSLWIHCNRCFYNYTNKQRSIYILSCYHLGCEKCIVIAVNEHEIICSICKETVKGYPIGNNLPNNLKDLFHPRPWTLSFPKIFSVLNFQTEQRNSFFIGCKKLKQFKKSCEKERDDLKEECIYWYDAEKLKKEKTKLLSVSKKLNK